jgi:uncharacterized membrane protein YqaE (UPF0057 family)
MKKILTFFALALLCLNLNAASVQGNWTSDFGDSPEVKALNPEMAEMGLANFLSLTPKKYKEMTGKRMTLKQTIQLKAAQKIVKKQMKGDPDIPKGLYIVGAILGFTWILMGVMDDFEGKNWWVNLILTALCWLPGFIHALARMGDYYGGGKN